VLAANGDDDVQSRPTAAVHAEIDHGVVFELAARNAGDEIGGEFFDFLAGDEARHVQRVDAAIGELRRDTGLGRIIAPAHPRIVGIARIGVVAMGKSALTRRILPRSPRATIAFMCRTSE
jgi:hypothetical protein